MYTYHYHDPGVHSYIYIHVHVCVLGCNDFCVYHSVHAMMLMYAFTCDDDASLQVHVRFNTTNNC
jgi:hypothetical protein